MMHTNTLPINLAIIRTQTIASLAAVMAAVILPQIFHIVGMATGVGPSLGQNLLPMFLPILLVSLLAGSWAGMVSGLLAPYISFALTGMPAEIMLPFITAELATIGFVAGALHSNRFPIVIKVMLAQLAGIIVFSVAILVTAYVLNNTSLGVSNIIDSVRMGWPGFLLQWALLPIIVSWVDKH